MLLWKIAIIAVFVIVIGGLQYVKDEEAREVNEYINWWVDDIFNKQRFNH